MLVPSLAGRAARLGSLPLVLLPFLAGGAPLRLAPDAPGVDEAMRRLGAEYGTGERKYASLAAKIEKALKKELAQEAWEPGEGAPERHLADHPFLATCAELDARLSAAQKARFDGQALLDRYGWPNRLELLAGLDFGSDRPVPRNTAGFVELEGVPDPFPGFPDLFVNDVLLGWDEVVSWTFRVEAKKKPTYAGRGPKDGPEAADELPAWEHVRVLLSGSPAVVPLRAIPELTVEIHARLAAARRAEDGGPAPADAMLAFLDTRWNGFTVQLPYAKDPFSFVQPLVRLVTDRKGFVYRFPQADHMAAVGDLPFVSINTLMDYARIFRGETLSSGDFISNTPAGRAALDAFWKDCAWLGRYRALLDCVVRAALTPDARFPAHLSYCDYPDGEAPASRAPGTGYDVPRAHAVLVWAWAGKDPARVADFLRDEVLAPEANRFPADVSLPAAFTQGARARESELLAAVVDRIAAEREANGGEPGDFEREFSPYPTYLQRQGQPTLGALLASFHAFHQPLAEAIRATAYGEVMDVIGK